MRQLTLKGKKRSTLCATLLLLSVAGEDANQKLEEKEDDFHPTEDGEAWTETFKLSFDTFTDSGVFLTLLFQLVEDL